MLKKRVFQKALSALEFTPEIDLFAPRLNKQIHKYVSFKPDSEVFEADAFFISRTNLKFYAFLPFSCISRRLKENKSGKGERYYSGTKRDNSTILFCTS